MASTEKRVTGNNKVTINTIREWLIHTTQLFARFAIILAGLGVALFVSVIAHLPVYVSYAIVLLVAAVLFIMIIMISIENIVYKTLKKSIWGQIVLYLLVAFISAQSYLWSIGEINRIFLVDPSNLALTSTALTAIQFFKYAIMALLSSYFIAIGLYFFYQFSENVAMPSVAQYEARTFRKKIGSGAFFVLTVTICLLVAGHLSKYSDGIVQDFAVKIDFYGHYTCTGADFNNIEGVLFLSASDILVAKKIESEWIFKKVRCEPEH
ncbi:hypothetical protein [Psychrobacter sp. 16-MNA-CIBAN-0192]|uniref:hypothetical protein n=1 Tax=Psychrobacter sp. 16-MNA-CIBAN-0192 TaxID=3140448 RepID=UPI00333150BE